MEDVIAERKERARKRAAAWRMDNPGHAARLMMQSHQKRKENWDSFLSGERSRYHDNEEKRRQKLERQRITRAAADPMKSLAYHRIWNSANKGKRAEYVAARRARRLAATPSWCDRDAIIALYCEARRLTLETGVPHEVDHIIPLKGKGVCGLHIPLNMQIITRRQNRTKHNGLSNGDDATAASGIRSSPGICGVSPTQGALGLHSGSSKGREDRSVHHGPRRRRVEVEEAGRTLYLPLSDLCPEQG
jgi:hypothetical protein